MSTGDLRDALAELLGKLCTWKDLRTLESDSGSDSPSGLEHCLEGSLKADPCYYFAEMLLPGPSWFTPDCPQPPDHEDLRAYAVRNRVLPRGLKERVVLNALDAAPEDASARLREVWTDTVRKPLFYGYQLPPGEACLAAGFQRQGRRVAVMRAMVLAWRPSECQVVFCHADVKHHDCHVVVCGGLPHELVRQRIESLLCDYWQKAAKPKPMFEEFLELLFAKLSAPAPGSWEEEWWGNLVRPPSKDLLEAPTAQAPPEIVRTATTSRKKRCKTIKRSGLKIRPTRTAMAGG
ncbi:unnamed protein product [Symbiodinium natans]|uniref:Uncharacterized protein n=1 Tax=Symbiodinium natans TaxID=878477 RepID=A0A812IBQ9_9DINO|nr:unnamed protein product [Symbiodinium natans]